MEAAAWLCADALGHSAAGGVSRRSGEAGLCWGVHWEGQGGNRGPKHRDMVLVMDRDLQCHRSALPGCPVPSFQSEMTMLQQIRLPGPPVSPLSGWGPSQPWCKDSGGTCKPPVTQPRCPACSTPRPSPAGFALGGCHGYPPPVMAHLDANPSPPHARCLWAVQRGTG